MGRQEHIAFLQTLPELSAFKPAELQELVSLLKPKPVHATQALYTEGDPPDACYFVLSGGLDVTITRSGKTHRLASASAGGLVGHLEMIDGQNRGATCVASKETMCLALSRATLDGLLDSNRPLGYPLLDLFSRLLVRQMRTANTKLTQLATGESQSAQPRSPQDPAVQAVFREVAGGAGSVSLRQR